MCIKRINCYSRGMNGTAIPDGDGSADLDQVRCIEDDIQKKPWESHMSMSSSGYTLERKLRGMILVREFLGFRTSKKRKNGNLKIKCVLLDTPEYMRYCCGYKAWYTIRVTFLHTMPYTILATVLSLCSCSGNYFEY